MAEVLAATAQAIDEPADEKLPAIPAESSSGSNQPPPPTTDEDTDHFNLPDIHKRELDSSTESLIKALGLAGADERSLGRLLRSVRGQVLSTIDELRTITTHDDNLERQYKEVVSENVQLNSALEKARGEIRHLKGQLSVLQMTSPEIRKHRARLQMRERRKHEHERQLQLSRGKYLGGDGVDVLNFAERARTVNARGEYVDHRMQLHPRRSTYPPPSLPLSPSSPPLPPLTKPQSYPLPPPLLGCRCSVCNAQQSLGALTLGSQPRPPLSSLLPPSSSSSLIQPGAQGQQQQQRPSLHITRSGQQILLGDRVIVKGERPGVVRYIGRLETDVQGHIFIGVHLVMPVGTCDGSLKGRQYFQCPPLHGVFVRPGDVLCVTGRKPCTGGTVVPRLQEKAPITSRRGSKQQMPLHWDPQQDEMPTPPSSTHSGSTMTRAQASLQEELSRANNMPAGELFNPSVQQMSHMMQELARKNKLKFSSQHTQQQQQQQEEEQEQQEQQEQEEQEETEEATPTPHQSHTHSPTELESTPPPQVPTPTRPSPSPQPQLPTPSPPPPAPTSTTPQELTTPSTFRIATPPPRSETPLETMLLRELRAKDLGSTGFVTGNEISAALTQLGRGKAVSEEETEQLLADLGIPRAESGGFPYNDIIPYLVEAIEGTAQTDI